MNKRISFDYGPKEKLLVFQDTFESQKVQSYTVYLAKKSRAPRPQWEEAIGRSKKPALKVGQRIIRGEKVVVRNGLLSVTVDHGRPGTEIEISSLDSPYQLFLNPNGYSAGCIDHIKYAQEIEQNMREGGRFHPQLFTIIFGIPKQIAIERPNSFRRVIKVTCAPYAQKNNGEIIDIVEESTIIVELVWKSPVVVIKNHRRIHRKYYNHNGVYLNQIAIKNHPIAVQLEEEDNAIQTSLSTSGAPSGVGFQKSMLLVDGENETVIYQPDFRSLEVEGGRVCVVRNRVKDNQKEIEFKGKLITVISQSWHQGWRPIPQEPKDYDDRLILVCDVGAWNKSAGNSKSLRDWITEIQNPLTTREKLFLGEYH